MKVWYYLHENSDLICKHMPVEVDWPGGFVRKVWEIDTDCREQAWILCIEALEEGANEERVRSLATKWKLTDDDGLEFAKRVDLKLSLDGDVWCAAFADFENIQNSQVGFGATALDAFVDLKRSGRV